MPAIRHAMFVVVAGAAASLGSPPLIALPGTIIGALVDESLLSATDASLGSLTTVDDTGKFLRSFNSNTLGTRSSRSRATRSTSSSASRPGR